MPLDWRQEVHLEAHAEESIIYYNLVARPDTTIVTTFAVADMDNNCQIY